MTIEVVAQTRTVQGRGASRRLRHAGKVPGILYGGKSEPVNLELDQNALFHQLRDEKFHASILTLALDGAKQQVLLRAVNMHPWKAEVQHIDFQRVAADQKIHIKVPLHFVNAEKSPAVKEQGGLITHVFNDIEIRCLPADFGHSIHVRDLAMPKGVELALGGNENPTVASAQIPKAAIAEEEAAAAAAAAVGVEGAAAPAEAVPAAADVPTVKQKAPEAAAPAADDKGGKGGKADKGDKK
jgi:large subunit ribosomal protein L25